MARKHEGAKLWLEVIRELKNRSVEDIVIACHDVLKGFPQAIEAVFPKAVVQTCIVHVIRNSMRFVGWQQRKAAARSCARSFVRQRQSAKSRAAAVHFVN